MWCRGSGLKPLNSSSEETEHDQDGTGEVISAAEGGEILVCVKKQDAEIYRNYRNFLFSHSSPPCHFLFSILFFWSLSHLLSFPL